MYVYFTFRTRGGRGDILMNTRRVKNEELLFITFVVSWDFMVIVVVSSLYRDLFRKPSPFSIHCITVQSIRFVVELNERIFSLLLFPIFSYFYHFKYRFPRMVILQKKVEKYLIIGVKLRENLYLYLLSVYLKSCLKKCNICI